MDEDMGAAAAVTQGAPQSRSYEPLIVGMVARIRHVVQMQRAGVKPPLVVRGGRFKGACVDVPQMIVRGFSLLAPEA